MVLPGLGHSLAVFPDLIKLWTERIDMRILLFEDHPRLATAVAKGLGQFGFAVDAFGTAADGLSAFSTIPYDAVILDLGLPDREGIHVLGDIREHKSATPVLILTARDGVDDRVTGLDAGADDYLVKPFAMSELAARIRAILRRPKSVSTPQLAAGNLILDTSTRQVTVNGKVVHFPPKEAHAVEMLLRRPGQVVPKSQLEDALYGLARSATPNSLEALISRVRRRLARDGASCSIHTFYGIGYLLRVEH